MKLLSLLITLFIVTAQTALAQSEALIEQVGSGNLVSLTQMTASQASLRQMDGAMNNVIQLHQEGNAVAQVLQTGSLNRLLGLDGVSAALSIDSQLFLTQGGIGNTAFVSQAAGAFASITQFGSGNTATVIQTGAW